MTLLCWLVGHRWERERIVAIRRCGEPNPAVAGKETTSWWPTEPTEPGADPSHEADKAERRKR